MYRDVLLDAAVAEIIMPTCSAVVGRLSQYMGRTEVQLAPPIHHGGHADSFDAYLPSPSYSPVYEILSLWDRHHRRCTHRFFVDSQKAFDVVDESQRGAVLIMSFVVRHS